jgi:hypothetical protein
LQLAVGAEIPGIQNEMVHFNLNGAAGKHGRQTSISCRKGGSQLAAHPSDSSVSRRILMNTRGATIATNDDRLPKPRPEAQRPVPQAGDILASERSARADVFAISIVPTGSDITVTRYSAAIERVQELARTRRVDGWFTNDHTHYARVASYRP